MQPINGFQHFTSHHCLTGSLRHIYAFHGYPLSEELLLGLGAGVGFVYWKRKGGLPFIGGRANLERPGVEGMEKTIGRRTGVQVGFHRTSSAAKAERTLLASLESGEPQMLILDMGFLPYIDFHGRDYHFGYHGVVACGYDQAASLVLIADRDPDLHPVSLEVLARARGSKYQPYPPRHAWLSFDFSQARPIQPQDLLQAIRDCAAGMLAPPIRNLGVAGIRTTAERILDWSGQMDAATLAEACMTNAIMIDARGGTGGGLFRSMYARFLEEAAVITGIHRLWEIAAQVQTAADQWEQIAGLLEGAYRTGDSEPMLAEVSRRLPQIAALEQDFWEKLAEIAADGIG